MNAEDFAKKEPMAMPGFTVHTPKQETVYDRMIQDKSKTGCAGCGSKHPAYPALQDVSADTGKKNSKR